MPTPHSPRVEALPNGRLKISTYLCAGLHALIVDADASAFDWEELYITFNCYGNRNQRTGPWDFNELDENRPVAPAYWVWLNGRKLGLWYFNRLSSTQIAERRFKGELGFLLDADGPCELEFQPYRRFKIQWDNVSLTPEPHDRMEPQPCLPLAQALLPETMPHNRFTPGFLNGVEFFKKQLHSERNSGFQLPSLAAAWHWRRDTEALEALRKVIRIYLDLPAWGNPREDGYGYNGDMAAATPLFGIAAALRWAGPALDDWRPEILARLEKQGDILLEMTLLHRGYWGGCMLQDHGIVTMNWFACAAYLLSDILPASRRWLAFTVPRVLRSLDAIPADGIIPETSYRRLWIYADKFPLFRELHQLAGGEDIYARAAIRAIPSALCALHLAETGQFAFPFTYGDLYRNIGGHAFLDRMASLGDPDARFLLETLMDPTSFTPPQDGYGRWHYEKEWLWALLFHREETPLPPLEETRICRSRSKSGPLVAHWFKDTGAGVVRTGASLLVAHCGPPIAHSSLGKLSCCNDRLISSHLSGNFIYLHGGRLVFCTAEGGYRQESATGNLLLLDGHGQRGDIGIPMSYPDAVYYGEAMQSVEAASGITMDLAPAYEATHHYHRNVRLDEQGRLHLLDRVEAVAGTHLQWRFQTSLHNGWRELTADTWELEVEKFLYRVSFEVEGAPANARLGETLSVWGYVSASGNVGCHHLAVEARSSGAPVALRLCVEAIGPAAEPPRRS